MRKFFHSARSWAIECVSFISIAFGNLLGFLPGRYAFVLVLITSIGATIHAIYRFVEGRRRSEPFVLVTTSSDWILLNKIYTCTFLATKHRKGITPSAQLSMRDDPDGPWVDVMANIQCDSQGNITITSMANPIGMRVIIKA
jgi:hypothetical protein